MVDMLDDIPMTDRDTTGDLYEYLRCGAAASLPPQHVSRLRLRLDHVAHRLHEHAHARGRGCRHRVPRLPVRGASGDDNKYSLILANPPFAGSLDYASTAKDLQRVVKTKKAELLFLALYPCLPG